MYSNGLYNGLCENYDVDVVVLRERRILLGENFHKLFSLVRAIFSSVPLNVVFHSSGIKSVSKILEDYKYVVVDHIEALGAVSGTRTPYVLISHNLEYKLSNDKIRNPALRSIFQLARKLRRYEYKGFAEAAGVISISATEISEISRYSKNVIQVLPVFSDRILMKNSADKMRIGFIGPASWPPNARTVGKLIDDILPNINRDFEFVLAGQGWDDDDFTLPPKTRSIGFVKETSEFWKNIDILVAPTEQGAGVNVKICEALHNGVMVITNTKSANAIYGMKPMPGGLLVADTDAQLLQTLNEVSYDQLANYNDEFSSAGIGEKLKRFVESLDD